MAFRRIAYSTLPLILVSIAGACGTQDRTCAPPTEQQMTASVLCARLQPESFRSGNTFNDYGQSCTVEDEFVTKFRELNPLLSVDAGGEAASDGASADGSTSDAATTDASDVDAALAEAGTPVAKCPELGRTIKVTCSYLCQFGRPFAGFEGATSRFQGQRGFFETSAQTEAASVDAFVILAAELVALGAPRGLVRDCLRSARDERRHARTMAALADLPPPSIRAPARPGRTAFEMALENARSGLVVETFAALVNHFQSLHAVDEELRAAFAAIAADESRHAALSRRIHEFLASRLTPSERGAVEAARVDAIAALRRELRASPLVSDDLVAIGLPTREQQSDLFAHLERDVFAVLDRVA